MPVFFTHSEFQQGIQIPKEIWFLGVLGAVAEPTPRAHPHCVAGGCLRLKHLAGLYWGHLLPSTPGYFRPAMSLCRVGLAIFTLWCGFNLLFSSVVKKLERY